MKQPMTIFNKQRQYYNSWKERQNNHCLDCGISICPHSIRCVKCARLGNKNGSWVGGRVNNSDGYILIYLPSHPFSSKHGYILEHRLIMEENIGRYLNNKEVVHHKNEKHSDNRLDNLILFSNNKEHINFHRRKKKE